MADPGFNPRLILRELDACGVVYVLVGGLGARAHGAVRPTSDIDLVPEGDAENLDRLALALRNLNARLRVGGLTDDEAKQLPVKIDPETLTAFGSSTWMTDAGPLDVLRELRDADGEGVPFDELVERGSDLEIEHIVVHVASLGDIIASKEQAGRTKDLEALPELRRLHCEES